MSMYHRFPSDVPAEASTPFMLSHPATAQIIYIMKSLALMALWVVVRPRFDFFASASG